MSWKEEPPQIIAVIIIADHYSLTYPIVIFVLM